MNPTVSESVAAPANACARRPLLVEMLGTLFAIRWLIGALLLALTLQAAVAPSFSWIAKQGVGAVQSPGATIASVIAAVGVPFLLIAVAQGITGFAERLGSKAVEQRLIIVLQRVYLDRRDSEKHARDVTQILYGCDLARKGFSVIYKDAWRLTAEITAIFLWQLSIGRDWLPVLILSVIPSLLIIWFVGPGIQRMSRMVLSTNQALAGRTGRLAKVHFERKQERLFRSVMHLEVLRWFADHGMAAILWVSFALLVGLSMLLDLGLVPADGDIASASSVAVNLALLAKPLGNIGKVYGKWREAMPAVLAVYGRSSARSPR